MQTSQRKGHLLIDSSNISRILLFIFNRMQEHIEKATGKEQVRHKHDEIKMVTRKARAELIRGSR